MLNRVAVGNNLAYYAHYLHEFKHFTDSIRSCVGVQRLSIKSMFLDYRYLKSILYTPFAPVDLSQTKNLCIDCARKI